MLTEEKAVDTKVKDLESIQKVEIDKFKQEIHIPKKPCRKTTK